MTGSITLKNKARRLLYPCRPWNATRQRSVRKKNTEAGIKSGCRRAAARNAGGREPAERVSAGAAFAALIAAFYADLIEYAEDVVYFCRAFSSAFLSRIIFP